MNLAIDIGNSFTHFGIYRGSRLVNSFKIPTHPKSDLKTVNEKYLDKYSGKINNAGISSVVPNLTKDWINFTIKKLKIKPLIVNNKCQLPIKIKVKNSISLGADRICDAVFAYQYFKGESNVVICDFGTANTYDVVLKNGDFIGGIIAPGITTSAIALSVNTGKLPLLNINNLKFRRSVIGSDTKQAIQSGLLNYPVYATECLVRAIESELKGEFKVIVTGGPAKMIQKKLSIKTVYVKNAVLDGINMILNYQIGLK
jgi:type III pantothenate kinase